MLWIPRPWIQPTATTHLRVESLEARTAPSVVPIGGEFRVNTYTTSSQTVPSVAVDQSGNFIVVWSSTQDGSNYGIYAQRYNSAGQPQGGEFRVNTYTTSAQTVPSVAMDRNGDFVVVWRSYEQDGSDYGIYAQRFNSTGLPQGGEFRVNTYTTGEQYVPRVAMDQAGDFVVVWRSYGQDGSGYGVYAQRYDSAGAPQGGEFRVNTYTTDAQLSPSVAMDQAGDFVVAWTSTYQDGTGASVYAQRYDSTGAPQGGEFLVNTYTTGAQDQPSVAMDQAGGFDVAWISAQDGDGVGVYAQRYNSAGVSQGVEFRVNTYTTDFQLSPSVAMDQAGDFVVAWRSFLQDGSGWGVYVQAYVAGGAPDGGEFRVNTYTTGNQDFQSVAMGQAGDFVVVWQRADGSGAGVYAQQYKLTESPTVTSAVVNGGAAQRSRVTTLDVTFSSSVTFTTTPAAAFTLTRNGGGTVGFTATANVLAGVTVVTLNGFMGTDTQFGSLSDGRYTLTVMASQVSANGQQMAANYTIGDAQGLFRFFGDVNGDRRIDISDFGPFSFTYNRASGDPLFNANFDFNNDGRIDIADFGQFGVRYFTTLP